MRSSKSSLFLLELMIVILVFAISAAVCVSLFVAGARKSAESFDASRAAQEAGNVAEAWRAAKGELSSVQRLCGGTLTAEGLLLFYDEDWNPTEDSAANRRLTLAAGTEAEGLLFAEITVLRGEDALIALEVLLREDRI